MNVSSEYDKPLRETGAVSLRQDGDGCGRIAAWGVGVLLVSLCFACWTGLRYPHYASGVLFQCGVVAIGLLWAFPGRVRPWRYRGDVLATALFGAYALFTVCSCLYAPNPRLALIGSIPIAFHVFWALALSYVLASRKHVRILLRAVFFAGLVAAAVGHAYVLGHVLAGQRYSLEHLLRVFGHRNFLAIFLLPPLLLCVAELAAKWFSAGKTTRGPLSLPRWAVLTVGAVMLLTMLLCQSIGAVLGLLAGGLCLVAMRLSRVWRGALLAGIVVLVVLAIVILSIPSVERWTAAHQQTQRWFIWKGAARMAQEWPAMGWGAGMFLPYFADFKPTEPMRYGYLTMVTLHPHNELLLVLVEGGVIGLLLYLGALGVAARRCLRDGDADADPVWRLTAWAVVAAFAAMLVQGVVTVSLRFWAPSALYWTLVGTMLGVSRMKSSASEVVYESDAQLALGAVRFTYAVVVAGLVGVFVIWSGARAEWLLGGAYRDVKAQRPNVGGKLRMARCEWWFPWGYTYRHASKEEFVSDMERAAGLSRYVPDYFMAFTDLGKGYERLGETAKAIEVYEPLEEQAPGYGHVRRLLGDLWLRRAKQERVEGYLLKSFEMYERALKQNPYDAASLLGSAEALIVASHETTPAAQSVGVYRNLRKALEFLGRFAEIPPRQGHAARVARALRLLRISRRLARELKAELLPEIESLEQRLQDESG